MPDIPRNAPCPCGSGKKYKLCHLPEDEARRPFTAPEAHRLDGRLTDRLLRFAHERFGGDFAPAADCPIALDPEGAGLQLLLPWAVYLYPVRGRTVVARYLESEPDLDPRKRVFLEAQARTAPSIWEVAATTPGEHLDLVDLLTGARSRVVEREGSRRLVARSVILARVVELPGVSVIIGVHPAPLGPERGAAAVQTVRAAAGGRVRQADLSRPEIARTVMESWDEAVERMMNAPPPVIANTDGDLLELCEDTFEIANGARREVLDRLLAVDGAEEADGRGRIVFLREGNAKHPDWSNTIVGHARVGRRWLVVETNSRARAEELGERVLDACGDLVRFEKGKVQGAEALMRRMKAERAGPEPREPDEGPGGAIVREMKAKHYEGWLDQPLPALGGMTPRQAAADATMRADLDLLLKEIEHGEARQPESHRYDARRLRLALGLGR